VTTIPRVRRSRTPASAACAWSWDRSATFAAVGPRVPPALAAPLRRPPVARAGVLRAGVLVPPEAADRDEALFDAPRAAVDRADDERVPLAAGRDGDRFAAPLADARLVVLLLPPERPEDDDLGCGMELLPCC
jgi:hypothetical protein